MRLLSHRMDRSAIALASRCAVAALLASFVGALAAQATRAPEAADRGALRADLVKTGLYVVEGGGANSLVRLSASGSVLVDGKSPGTYRALMSQLRKISKLSDLPVRVLIVTDHHEDRTGNHANFVQAGVAVIAQQGAAQYLPSTTAAVSAKRTPGPLIRYDADYTLRIGGVPIDLHHYGAASTSGDTVVHFPDLKVVAVGDLYAAAGPDPDYAAGGSLLHWGTVIGEVLKLDFDLIAPSVGPLAKRADLERFKQRLDSFVAQAADLVKHGAGKEELGAAIEGGRLGWRLKLSAAQIEGFYAELSKAD